MYKELEHAPNYSKITDSTSLEYSVSNEFTTLKDKALELAKKIEDTDVKFVNGLQNGHIESWEEVGAMLNELLGTIKATYDEMLDYFY